MLTIERLGLQAIFNEDAGKSPPGDDSLQFLAASVAQRVRKFHQSLPGYQPTPLFQLTNLGRELGLGQIYLKDESGRFGQNAFKVLGSSYAMARLLGRKLGLAEETPLFPKLRKAQIKEKITFTTATSGNHGRGVAWTAKQLGQRAVIYLPAGSAHRRVEAIEDLGSKAIVTDLNYDDAVRLAAQTAQEKGWFLVQDTAWEGYEEIPRWIMQGYTTIAAEIDEQLAKEALPRPTHLFLQVGVGSFASAILAYFLNKWPGQLPQVFVVEPDRAACILASAAAGGEEPLPAVSDLESIMSGLSCKEANPLAWTILAAYAQGYLACPDYVAAQGVRILANPLGSDEKIVAGEAGAVSTGLLALLFREKESAELKDKLGLNADSRVLLISTEGDTDPLNYREIVWDGKYPLPQA